MLTSIAIIFPHSFLLKTLLSLLINISYMNLFRLLFTQKNKKRLID